MISWVEKNKIVHVGKIIQFSEAEEAANTIAPTSIHIKRSTGCVSDWSILNNDWPIQKFD